jgi:hypothetical protein
MKKMNYGNMLFNCIKDSFKTIEKMKYINIPLQKDIAGNDLKISYRTGTEFLNCEICDKGINENYPGKRIRTKVRKNILFIHVCNECFKNSEYQEMLKNYNVIRITDI